MSLLGSRPSLARGHDGPASTEKSSIMDVLNQKDRSIFLREVVPDVIEPLREMFRVHGKSSQFDVPLHSNHPKMMPERLKVSVETYPEGEVLFSVRRVTSTIHVMSAWSIIYQVRDNNLCLVRDASVAKNFRATPQSVIDPEGRICNAAARSFAQVSKRDLAALADIFLTIE